MGRHSRDVSRRGRQAVAIAAPAASVGVGIFLAAWGNHLAAQDYNYSVAPWGFWGTFFIAAPLLALAIRVIAGILKAIAVEHGVYREWKASLPAEQRAAVELTEAAVLTAAAIAAHEHHKRTDAWLTASAMGQAPLNRVHAGIMDGSARLMARGQAARAEHADNSAGAS